MLLYVQSFIDSDVVLCQWTIAFMFVGLACSYGCYSIMKNKGYCVSKCLKAVPIAFIPILGFIYLVVSACTPQATQETKGKDGAGLSLFAVTVLTAIIAVLFGAGCYLLRLETGWSFAFLDFFATVWFSLLLYSKV